MVATINGSGSFDIKAALTNEIIGGRLDLRMQVSNTVEKVVPFFIRGKNPLDAIARAYIDANVDEEFRSYAWMIAKHESKSGDRVYNQFNPSGSRKELPNKTAGDNRWGWGMCQIDGSNTTSGIVWEWKKNVDRMNFVLRQKKAYFNMVVGWFRSQYQGDPTTRWHEPDNISTNLSGITLSAKDWTIATLYNGAGGTPRLNIPGRPHLRSPIHFNPATTNWVLYTNSYDYVPTMAEDSISMEEE